MLRLIVAVVLTAALVAFAMANGHHVPVSPVVGAPIYVRTIFLLGTAMGVGVVGTLLVQQYLRFKGQRERQRLAPRKRRSSSRELLAPEDLPRRRGIFSFRR